MVAFTLPSSKLQFARSRAPFQRRTFARVRSDNNDSLRPEPLEMHHDFWHERWQTGQIGFHQSAVHPFLARWWPTLDLPAGARVYVPLCGKSLDMAWLAGRGHAIVGSELSSIAIRDFFAGQELEPARAELGGFIRHTAGPYVIIEGDALALTPAQTGPIEAVYDRAALVALPPGMRVAYAASLARLTPPGAQALLVAFEYPQEMKGGPPFSVEAAEIRELFQPAFTVREVERLDILAESPKFAEIGIPALYETAVVLGRR
jgi:thiopurine S-methyltransferase